MSKSKQSLYHHKIMSLGAFLPIRAELRKAGKHVVFTNGCFDILHPGHVQLLAEAKSKGDALVVALNTDFSVKRLGKGTDRPINPLEVRSFVIAHLESVDFVISFDQNTPLEIITAIKPEVLVKGGDWSVDRIVGGESVIKNGGSVFSLPLLEGYSTTALVEYIRRSAK